jgi:hypothetical protein
MYDFIKMNKLNITMQDDLNETEISLTNYGLFKKRCCVVKDKDHHF